MDFLLHLQFGYQNRQNNQDKSTGKLPCKGLFAQKQRADEGGKERFCTLLNLQK